MEDDLVHGLGDGHVDTVPIGKARASFAGGHTFDHHGRFGDRLPGIGTFSDLSAELRVSAVRASARGDKVTDSRQPAERFRLGTHMYT